MFLHCNFWTDNRIRKFFDSKIFYPKIFVHENFQIYGTSTYCTYSCTHIHRHIYTHGILQSHATLYLKDLVCALAGARNIEVKYLCNLLVQVQLAPPGSLLFRPDMRLEAKDPSYPEEVRVATIKKVTDKQLLIHFDGYADKKDYWCASDSPDIHPPMWSGKHWTTVKKPRGQ